MDARDRTFNMDDYSTAQTVIKALVLVLPCKSLT